MYLWSEYFVGIQSIKLPNVFQSWNKSQKLLLNKFFQENMHPNSSDIAEYARKLGVSVENVKNWFIRKQRAMALEERKHSTLRSMCQFIIYWKYVQPKWNDNSFPFIICVVSSSEENSWLQHVYYHRFNTLAKEELKRTFQICPYPTPAVKVMLPKTLNSPMEKVCTWFLNERKKIQPEIQIKKCKSTNNIV